MIGKPYEEIRFRKLLKEKLKVTKIPNLHLENNSADECVYFKDYYNFHQFLGAGSFGFVVSAQDKNNGEILALKVCS
jgi:hypothetical protein